MQKKEKILVIILSLIMIVILTLVMAFLVKDKYGKKYDIPNYQMK